MAPLTLRAKYLDRYTRHRSTDADFYSMYLQYDTLRYVFLTTERNKMGTKIVMGCPSANPLFQSDSGQSSFFKAEESKRQVGQKGTEQSKATESKEGGKTQPAEDIPAREGCSQSIFQPVFCAREKGKGKSEGQTVPVRLTSAASFSNFSMVLLSMPPHLQIRWPVVVDLPESTCPMTTMLIWVFSFPILQIFRLC